MRSPDVPPEGLSHLSDDLLVLVHLLDGSLEQGYDHLPDFALDTHVVGRVDGFSYVFY